MCTEIEMTEGEGSPIRLYTGHCTYYCGIYLYAKKKYVRIHQPVTWMFIGTEEPVKISLSRLRMVMVIIESRAFLSVCRCKHQVEDKRKEIITTTIYSQFLFIKLGFVFCHIDFSRRAFRYLFKATTPIRAAAVRRILKKISD